MKRSGRILGLSWQQYSHPTAEKFAIGLIAIGGLIVAACISAVPSAQCRAMADLYARTIDLFGGIAFSGLFVLFLSYLPLPKLETSSEIPRIVWVNRVSVYVVRISIYAVALSGMALFGAGAIATDAHLQSAVNACWATKDHAKPLSPFEWLLDGVRHPYE